MSITRINECQAAEGKAEELFEFLNSLVPYISSSEGCLGCEVLRNSESQGSFVVIEKWASIECHKKSIDNFPREEMQAAMSLFGAPPKGAYYHA
ncbi:MAG: putative quinol monooxygenase [Ardenticatenaceae bacterium]